MHRPTVSLIDALSKLAEAVGALAASIMVLVLALVLHWIGLL
jgi:hypothetical protein